VVTIKKVVCLPVSSFPLAVLAGEVDIARKTLEVFLGAEAAKSEAVAKLILSLTVAHRLALAIRAIRRLATNRPKAIAAIRPDGLERHGNLCCETLRTGIPVCPMGKIPCSRTVQTYVSEKLLSSPARAFYAGKT